MRNLDEAVNDWVVAELSRTGKIRTAKALKPVFLPNLGRDASLNLGILRKFDSGVVIRQGRAGLVHVRTAFRPMVNAGVNYMTIMHPGHNIRMTEDILAFEPDEELINMSENPLWIIQPEDEFNVAIKRIF